MTGRLTGAVAIAAAIPAVVLVGTGPVATVVGVAGLAALVAGLAAGRGAAVTLGSAGLFAATLAAGVEGVGAPTVVTASGATVVAWTVGRTSVDLRSDLSGTDARRLEATHAAGTTAIVGAACAIALLPRFLSISPSPLGLVLLLGGAIALTAALASS